MERHRHPAQRRIGDPRSTPILSADPPPATETVSLLVPLLNDAHRVSRIARALTRQIRVPKLDIVFLDAGSTDLTRQLLLQSTADDPRVRLLVGSTPPKGWCAYAHACEQLAIAARGKTFVFLDPGLALAPGAVAAAVAALRGTSHDLIVAQARRRTVDADADTGGGARLLAVDAGAYWRVGGHAAAAHDPLGEGGLIRALRRAGARVASADGRHAIEFLDGSSWPRERAGVAPSTSSATRHGASDTENSILHSFTDTARRLLSVLALLPPVPPVHSPRAALAASRPLPSRPGTSRTIRANQSYAAIRGASVAAAIAPDPCPTQPHDPFLLDESYTDIRP